MPLWQGRSAPLLYGRAALRKDRLGFYAFACYKIMSLLPCLFFCAGVSGAFYAAVCASARRFPCFMRRFFLPRTR